MQIHLKRCLIFIRALIISDEMKINFVGKRHPPFHHWEPIYIGTNEDPLYDERLSWEGRADKMTQVNWYSTRLYKHRLLGLLETMSPGN